jgi:hypothetical protein
MKNKKPAMLVCFAMVAVILFGGVAWIANQYRVVAIRRQQIDATIASVSVGSDRSDAVAIILPITEEHRRCERTPDGFFTDVFVVRNGDGYMITTLSEQKAGGTFIVSIGTLESVYRSTFAHCRRE